MRRSCLSFACPLLVLLAACADAPEPEDETFDSDTWGDIAFAIATGPGSAPPAEGLPEGEATTAVDCAPGVAGCAEDDAWLTELVVEPVSPLDGHVTWLGSQGLDVATDDGGTGFVFQAKEAELVATLSPSAHLRSETWVGGATLTVDGVVHEVEEATVTSAIHPGGAFGERLCPGAVVASVAGGGLVTMVWGPWSGIAPVAPLACQGPKWKMGLDVALVVAAEGL